MNRYEIEYRLQYSKYHFDTISHIFEGKNKTEAIKNYNRETGVPVSRIINVELITDDNDYNYDNTPVGISENGKKMCRKK